MVKRSFWLLLAALGAWLLWQWMQQRRDEMLDRSPQFAPPRPYVPPAPGVPADDDQVAPVTVPPPVPATPPAPPSDAALDATPDTYFAPADDDQVAAPPAPPAPPSDAALDALFAPEEQPAAPAEARADDLADAVAAALEEADDAATEPPATFAAAPASESPASAPDKHGVAAGTEAGAPIEEEVLGYCVRCRAKRPMQHPHEEFSESGRRAARGTCPVCGATMFTFLAANDEEQGASA